MVPQAKKIRAICIKPPRYSSPWHRMPMGEGREVQGDLWRRRRRHFELPVSYTPITAPPECPMAMELKEGEWREKRGGVGRGTREWNSYYCIITSQQRNLVLEARNDWR